MCNVPNAFVCTEVKAIIRILIFTRFFKHIAIIFNTAIYIYSIHYSIKIYIYIYIYIYINFYTVMYNVQCTICTLYKYSTFLYYIYIYIYTVYIYVQYIYLAALTIDVYIGIFVIICI